MDFSQASASVDRSASRSTILVWTEISQQLFLQIFMKSTDTDPKRYCKIEFLLWMWDCMRYLFLVSDHQLSGCVEKQHIEPTGKHNILLQSGTDSKT